MLGIAETDLQLEESLKLITAPLEKLVNKSEILYKNLLAPKKEVNEEDKKSPSFSPSPSLLRISKAEIKREVKIRAFEKSVFNDDNDDDEEFADATISSTRKT